MWRGFLCRFGNLFIIIYYIYEYQNQIKKKKEDDRNEKE
nr:MAG TPA: hypothetical protein [Caudoviricetes sp.]